MEMEELEASQPALRASTRVALTPELVVLIFRFTDRPRAFNVSCRAFHAIATKPSSIYDWFKARFWPFEMFYELLTWPYLLNTDVLEYFDSHRIRPSKFLYECVSEIGKGRSQVSSSMASFWGINLSRLQSCTVQDRKLSFLRFMRRKQDRSSERSPGLVGLAQFILHLHPHGRHLNWWSDQNGAIQLPPDRQGVETLLQTYGFDICTRFGYATLIYALLLVGFDLEWWQATLQEHAGVVMLLPEELVETVLYLLISRGSFQSLWMLRWVHPHHRTTPLNMPANSAAWLVQRAGRYQALWTAGAAILMETALPGIGGRRGPSFVDLPFESPRWLAFKAILESADPNILPTFIAHFMLQVPWMIGWKANFERCQHWLWYHLLRESTQNLQDELQVQVQSAVIIALACESSDHPAFLGRKAKREVLKQCLNERSVELALSDSSTTLEEAGRVLSYCMRFLKNDWNFDDILKNAAIRLMTQSACGGHLLQLQAARLWLKADLEVYIVQHAGIAQVIASGLSTHAQPPTVGTTGSEIPMIEGIRAYVCKEAWNRKHLSDAHKLPNAIALLSLFDKNSAALQCVLKQARKDRRADLVKRYEAHGVADAL